MCDSINEVRDHEENGRDRLAERLIEWLETVAALEAFDARGDGSSVSIRAAGKEAAYKRVIERLNRVLTEPGFRG